jgi:hypothetical protein
MIDTGPPTSGCEALLHVTDAVAVIMHDITEISSTPTRSN